MMVDSTKEVERIVYSVIQQYGLTKVRVSEIRVDRLGWLVTVVGGQNTRSSFAIRPGTPVSVRMAVVRGLGVDDE
jgi:hypothetical protein